MIQKHPDNFEMAVLDGFDEGRYTSVIWIGDIS